MKYRIYYIHNMPGKPFIYEVESPKVGLLVLDALYNTMLDLFDRHVIPDYANVGGVEYFDEHFQEWHEWDEDADYEPDYSHLDSASTDSVREA